MGDMGLVRTTIGIESFSGRGHVVHLPDVPVDTESIHTWVPAPMPDALGVARERVDQFTSNDGPIVQRAVGFVITHADGTSTADLVVFAEPADRVRLGWWSLSGLNLRVDPVRKDLVPAGPVLAAAAGCAA